MRLATIQTANGNRLAGVHLDGDRPRFVDLAAADPALPADMTALLPQPDALAQAAAAFSKAVAEGRYLEGTLTVAIPNPGKVICIGLNYRDHAVESGAEIPAEPVVFNKFPTAVTGPDCEIVLPAVCKMVDYEAELVVVIGKRGRNIAHREALSHVAGYMNGNDVSARDWQLGRPGGQWLMGKTPDTFAPIGPWLVTAEDVPDPHRLAVSLRLNGQTMQNSSTKELIFGIDHLIAHISQLVTLEPGDLIFTGTPPGVGMARKPPVFLKPGDTVEVEIEGLGVLRNRVAAEA